MGNNSRHVKSNLFCKNQLESLNMLSPLIADNSDSLSRLFILLSENTPFMATHQ